MLKAVDVKLAEVDSLHQASKPSVLIHTLRLENGQDFLRTSLEYRKIKWVCLNVDVPLCDEVVCPEAQS